MNLGPVIHSEPKLCACNSFWTGFLSNIQVNKHLEQFSHSPELEPSLRCNSRFLLNLSPLIKKPSTPASCILLHSLWFSQHHHSDWISEMFPQHECCSPHYHEMLLHTFPNFQMAHQTIAGDSLSFLKGEIASSDLVIIIWIRRDCKIFLSAWNCKY